MKGNNFLINKKVIDEGKQLFNK